MRWLPVSWPFVVTAPPRYSMRSSTGAPVAPVRLNLEIPAELEHIINRALEKDRNLRYQSVGHEGRTEPSQTRRRLVPACSRLRRTMKRRRRELLERTHPAPRVGVGCWISK